MYTTMWTSNGSTRRANDVWDEWRFEERAMMICNEPSSSSSWRSESSWGKWRLLLACAAKRCTWSKAVVMPVMHNLHKTLGVCLILSASKITAHNRLKSLWQLLGLNNLLLENHGVIFSLLEYRKRRNTGFIPTLWTGSSPICFP